jgi:hypothetical protein
MEINDLRELVSLSAFCHGDASKKDDETEGPENKTPTHQNPSQPPHPYFKEQAPERHIDSNIPRHAGNASRKINHH